MVLGWLRAGPGHALRGLLSDSAPPSELNSPPHCRLAPGVALILQDLIGKRSRFNQLDGTFELIAPSPGALVHMTRFVRHFYPCNPFELAVGILSNWTRNPAYPGTQKARQIPGGWCRQLPTPMCWPNSGEFTDMATIEVRRAGEECLWSFPVMLAHSNPLLIYPNPLPSPLVPGHGRHGQPGWIFPEVRGRALLV